MSDENPRLACPRWRCRSHYGHKGEHELPETVDLDWPLPAHSLGADLARLQLAARLLGDELARPIRFLLRLITRKDNA